MANKIRFHPGMIDDLTQAIGWYDTKSHRLGDRFRVAVKCSLEEIERSPEANSRVFDDEDIRYRQIRSFPYLVLFRLHPGIIHIGGLVHSASDPKKWHSRMSDI
ncbi:type II toxin-antitoxin system RelE/ParE family toxin [Bythopirellula goksoeyrii]|uniref:Plasmid stabilization system protein n=1 Tax=Bythopirellula goksoeyrii TaxID=1400387 RepID=A0A5B9QCM3_9BACT|nr:type II toxin-antitoxin system RelE/ParE family toxin [Bythopirellula goksoeyrii]QEG35370.1 hypothetical protein Pr1d_26680 [Bythopirellula goksoeyrii]